MTPPGPAGLDAGAMAHWNARASDKGLHEGVRRSPDVAGFIQLVRLAESTAFHDPRLDVRQNTGSHPGGLLLGTDDGWSVQSGTQPHPTPSPWSYLRSEQGRHSCVAKGGDCRCDPAFEFGPPKRQCLLRLSGLRDSR